MSTRARELAGTLFGYGLLEITLWSPPRIQIPLGLATISLIVVLASSRAKSARALGLAPRSGWWLIAAAIGAAAVCVSLAFVFGTLHGVSSLRYVWPRTLLYFVWAFLQEFMLQSFFFASFERLFGTRYGIGIATTLFSLAHLPNVVLVVLTAATAVAFCSHFARHRNLWAVALAHAILGLAVAVSVPDAVHHHMRVGWGYVHGGAARP